MKGGQLYKKIIYSSWLLALIPAAALMLFIKPAGLRYMIYDERSKLNSLQLQYADLNSDSVSEMISSYNGDSYSFITVKTTDLRIYDQWNLEDSLDHGISTIITGNYDTDKFSELYVFSYRNDSLFLNINELLDNTGLRLRREHIFITRIGVYRGHIESVLYPAGFFDRNGDGYKEFYFGISSGFNLGPRKVYSFDIVNNRLDSSSSANSIPLNTRMSDVDDDQRPEIFGDLSASGNFRADVQYSDSSTWLMVFNDDLEFEFPPVEFKGFGNILEINPFNRSYAVLHWTGGTDTSAIPSRVMIYDTEGKLLRSRSLTELGYTQQPSEMVFSHVPSDRLVIVGSTISELNGDLEVIRSFHVPFKSEFFTRRADVNDDDKDEILIYSELEENLLVLDEDLRLIAETKMLARPAYQWDISNVRSGKADYRTVISAGDSVHYLELKHNRFYFLSFLRYPGIYIAFLLFIALIRRINTLQVVQKEDLKQRLLMLQLQGIKAQLDPHFTFNTLNSVASLIYLKERQNAYDYLNKFTQLLRIMLNDAEKIYRHLGEEIEFVTLYLELEKLRFDDKLNYRIEIGEGVTQRERVPKLVLHTFAENAIKHGILPKAEGGTIIIRVTKEGDYLKLVVEDNGIGRALANNNHSADGKGLKLTGEFYDILNQLNVQPVSFSFHDLHNNDGKPAGTRVEVSVPLELGVLTS